MENSNNRSKDNRHDRTANRESRLALVFAALAILFLAIGLASCNVTRTITTTAQTVQRGDTTVTIMTKTVETYDGAVDASKFLTK